MSNGDNKNKGLTRGVNDLSSLCIDYNKNSKKNNKNNSYEKNNEGKNSKENNKLKNFNFSKTNQFYTNNNQENFSNLINENKNNIQKDNKQENLAKFDLKKNKILNNVINMNSNKIVSLAFLNNKENSINKKDFKKYKNLDLIINKTRKLHEKNHDKTGEKYTVYIYNLIYILV